MNDNVYVIMHKNVVHKGNFFLSNEAARNWVKMNNPKRKFKEPTENMLVCTYTGATFKIVKLSHG